MRLKLVALAVTGPSPFLLFLPRLKTTEVPYTLTKLSYQEDGLLLLNEKDWKIKLNTKDCRYLGQIDYAEVTKFVVKCKDYSNSKELAFPAYARLYEDSISFWVELEKEEFSSNLVHFYNFFWKKNSKEKTHKPISDNCLFEGTYSLVNWRELNNLIKSIKRNWVKLNT